MRLDEQLPAIVIPEDVAYALDNWDKIPVVSPADFLGLSDRIRLAPDAKNAVQYQPRLPNGVWRV